MVRDPLVQDARNSHEERKALALVDSLDVVWPSPAECESALDHFAQLHLPHGLGLLDSLIAATAVGHGSVLNTFNERHYRMFPGLTIVRPYRRWCEGRRGNNWAQMADIKNF